LAPITHHCNSMSPLPGLRQSRDLTSRLRDWLHYAAAPQLDFWFVEAHAIAASNVFFQFRVIASELPSALPCGAQMVITWKICSHRWTRIRRRPTRPRFYLSRRAGIGVYLWLTTFLPRVDRVSAVRDRPHIIVPIQENAGELIHFRMGTRMARNLVASRPARPCRGRTGHPTIVSIDESADWPRICVPNPPTGPEFLCHKVSKVVT